MTPTTMNPKPAPKTHQGKGAVYCPICTHTVSADVITSGRMARVVPGQRCARCSGSLDAGVVLYQSQAA